jgi:hypothetical protein
MAMKRGIFRCSKCDRTFAMAPHLGRHMATIHGAKRKTPNKPGGRRPRAASASGGALDGQGLLSSIRAYRHELEAQQAEVARQLAALDQAMCALGANVPKPGPKMAAKPRGRAAGRPPAKPGHEGSLRSYIDQVLRTSGQRMRVAEITAAVRAAGYPTHNKRLGHSVAKLLAVMATVAKTGRGVYRAK